MFEKRFDRGVNRSPLDEARSWLRRAGYKCGRSQDSEPIGIACMWTPNKWRRLTPEEKAKLDGTIEPTGDGGVIVRMKQAPYGHGWE